MELAILFFLLIILALLAHRFGADSRAGFQPSAHDQGRAGIAWIPAPLVPAPASNLDTGTGEPVAASPDRALASPCPDANSPYPTLNAIDRARGTGPRPFAADPDAAYLERRARDLTGRYWSDHAWLTGMIDQARLDTVCRELDRERRGLGATVLVLPERSPIAS